MMERDGRAAAALALASAFLLFGFNTTETAAMPELVRSSGGGAFLAGAQNSFYVLLAVLLRPLFGPLADRRGARLVMAIGAAGFCGPCLALPFCHDPLLVVALHLVQSIGLAAYHPCVSSYLTALSAPDRLGRRLGALRFVTTAAAMLGPAALFPLIGAAGYPAFFGALALVALAGLACVLALPRLGAGAATRDLAARQAPRRGSRAGGRGSSDPEVQPAEPDAAAPRRPASAAPRWWRGLGRRQVMLLALPLLLGAGYSVVLNYGQALARASFPGMNEGLLFTVFSVGGLAGSVIAGRAFDAWGARRPVAAGLGCLAAGLVLITQGWLGPAALLAGGVLGGLGYYGANAACAAGVGALAAVGRRSALFSAQQSCLDVGIVAGGLVSAALVALGSPVSVAYLAMAALAMICLPIWGILYPREN